MSRLRKNLLWGLALVALLVASTAAEVWLEGAPSVPLATNVLIFALVNVNILLLMAFVLLLFRNLAKLFLERRRKVIGARLRTRLVVAFVGLASLPALVLFLVSWRLVTTSVQGWFDARVEASLRLASDLAIEAGRNTERTALGQAERLAEEIGRLELAGPQHREDLARHLRARVRQFGLAAVSWYDAPDGRPDLLAVEAGQPAPPPPHLPPERLRDAWGGRSGLVTSESGGGQSVQGYWPVRGRGAGPVRGVVAAALFVPGDLRERLAATSDAYESYRQLRLFQAPIRLSYTLTLATIALLITFSATWFAFYLSRVITTPIQRLAEGTRRIAGGDLDFEITADAQDEIGLLVASFNRMTRDLRSNKAELERAYRTLQRSSLELERRTEMIETILETVATGVISLDPRGLVTTCNRSAGLMLGVSPAAAVGRPAEELFTDPALRQLREAATAPAGGGAWDGRVALAGGGVVRSLVVNVVALRDRRGADLGRLVVLEDLTQLVAAQRAAAWREAARRIAHEIKNPLTPIQLSVQRARKKLLERSPDREAVALEATATVLAQVDAMKRLVDEFSRFARLPSRRPEALDLREVIGSALELYRRARRGVAFRAELGAAPLPLEADREQLRRVFINLFENALDALDGPGSVTVTTEPLDGGGAVRVRVADTGRGIPSGDRDRVFLPDVTTKKEGGGLGLAIVSDIVAEHGGTVRVEENRPRGSAFIIELPLRRDGAPGGGAEGAHAG